VPDIVQSIFGDYGLSAFFEKSLSKTYAARDFCLQYRETDLDFVKRLLEEEGIYFYFRHKGEAESFVLADGAAAHEPMPGDPVVEYHEAQESFDPSKERFYEVVAKEGATTGKVTLADYNFETSGTKLLATREMPTGKHGQNGVEIYDYPGHFRTAALGDDRVRVRMEAEAVKHVTWTAVGNIVRLGVGQTFQLKNHPQTQGESNFLCARATYYIQSAPEAQSAGDVQGVLTGGLSFDPTNTDVFRAVFDIIPEAMQFRAPLVTPWPEVQGIHTAVVVGPAGEEIHTDKYGRVKIKFHWDKRSPKDDAVSVWVRAMMPWTGKGWGMIHIPRIGQEVVVQFEEGDPDRPIIIGMLYNDATMPPYALPANQTQSGIKTNSSKGGSGYNELMMEDKKGAELVRFKSQRDYHQVVQNDAKISVGLETKDKGDMELTVHRHLAETLKTGNHSFKVEAGSQTIKIKKDKAETIEGKSTQIITGDMTEQIEKGNFTRTVDMGNETTTVKMGDHSLKTSLGSIMMEAMQSITLKVGGNSIVIDQMGVTIKGIKVSIEAQAMLDAKSPMTTVKGDGVLTLKGGFTFIN
jgi:type VI secretion system secreted protein VgrG